MTADQIPDVCKGFRTVLDSSTGAGRDRDATWDAAEKHTEGCDSCLLYLEQVSNMPITDKEDEALTVFKEQERIWRTCCPSLDSLRAHTSEVDVDVRSHLTICEPCQQDLAQLLDGKDVVRNIPKNDKVMKLIMSFQEQIQRSGCAVLKTIRACGKLDDFLTHLNSCAVCKAEISRPRGE
jgi:hypothetical protein